MIRYSMRFIGKVNIVFSGPSVFVISFRFFVSVFVIAPSIGAIIM